LPRPPSDGGIVIDMMGLMAALVGKAIGVEWLHRRKQKKRLLVVVESDRRPEHPGETRPLPKLIGGPVEEGAGTRGH
jgi:hypothetical protein